jgi:hypothetical protein
MQREQADVDELGTMMALSLDLQDPHALRLLTAYEDGRVAYFTYTRESTDLSLPVMVEGEGWTKVFERREHKEPGKPDSKPMYSCVPNI